MIDYISEVFKKFVPITGTSIPVTDNIRDVVEHYLSNPNFICIAEENKGVLLGVVVPAFWNPEVLVAQELGWWVEPEHRKSGFGARMLLTFEKKAKEMGAKEIMMICLENSEPEKVGLMYEKLGYSKAEYVYMKRL